MHACCAQVRILRADQQSSRCSAPRFRLSGLMPLLSALGCSARPPLLQDVAPGSSPRQLLVWLASSAPGGQRQQEEAWAAPAAWANQQDREHQRGLLGAADAPLPSPVSPATAQQRLRILDLAQQLAHISGEAAAAAGAGAGGASGAGHGAGSGSKPAALALGAAAGVALPPKLKFKRHLQQSAPQQELRMQQQVRPLQAPQLQPTKVGPRYGAGRRPTIALKVKLGPAAAAPKPPRSGAGALTGLELLCSAAALAAATDEAAASAGSAAAEASSSAAQLAVQRRMAPEPPLASAAAALLAASGVLAAAAAGDDNGSKAAPVAAPPRLEAMAAATAALADMAGPAPPPAEPQQQQPQQQSGLGLKIHNGGSIGHQLRHGRQAHHYCHHLCTSTICPHAASIWPAAVRLIPTHAAVASGLQQQLLKPADRWQGSQPSISPHQHSSHPAHIGMEADLYHHATIRYRLTNCHRPPTARAGAYYFSGALLLELFGVVAEGKQEHCADLYLDGALVRSRHPVCVVRYSKGQYIRGATGAKGGVPRSALLQGMAWGPGRKALVLHMASS
jgi:hypothetical protein